MEELAIETMDYVLAKPDALEIIAKFVKVRDASNYIIVIRIWLD